MRTNIDQSIAEQNAIEQRTARCHVGRRRAARYRVGRSHLGGQESNRSKTVALVDSILVLPLAFTLALGMGAAVCVSPVSAGPLGSEETASDSRKDSPTEEDSAADDSAAEDSKPEDAEREEAEPRESSGGDNHLRGEQSWHSTLAAGRRTALADGKPLLIRATARWCASCPRFVEAMWDPAVTEELRHWALVDLDVTLDFPQDAGLDIEGVPALIAQTPDGHSVGSHEGLMSSKQVVQWLKDQRKAALDKPADVLLEDETPKLIDIIRLVRQFERQRPALRAAAVNRLRPYPAAAANQVLRVLKDGSLSARLAALELLEYWEAPIAGIDPWEPDTVSDDRLARVEQWIEQLNDSEPPGDVDTADASADGQPEQGPSEPPDDSLAAARAEIDRMLRVDAAEAAAIRHRLAHWGDRLLPEIRRRMQGPLTDRWRQRLRAFRYRLAAPDALVLQWPTGIERLSATDTALRREAAEELAARATDDALPLLLALFSDSDPMVREISLRGLQHVGGKQAIGALVRLLDDPEPNVRAAVLKQLAEQPQPMLVPAVARYVENESDADLIVHAIRFLQTVKVPASIQALVGLLEHESWQVRAEAAESLGKTITYSTPDNIKADVYVALLRLLEDDDPFVISRAVEGLDGIDMEIAVDPLVKAAERHPQLAPVILRTLSRGDSMRVHALKALHRFRRHEKPVIRKAALQGLVEMQANLSSGGPYSFGGSTLAGAGKMQVSIAKELPLALNDSAAEVRIAAAKIIIEKQNAIGQAAARAIREAAFPSELATRGYYAPEVSGYHDPFGGSVRITPSTVMGSALRKLAGFMAEAGAKAAEEAEKNSHATETNNATETNDAAETDDGGDTNEDQETPATEQQRTESDQPDGGLPEDIEVELEVDAELDSEAVNRALEILGEISPEPQLDVPDGASSGDIPITEASPNLESTDPETAASSPTKQEQEADEKLSRQWREWLQKAHEGNSVWPEWMRESSDELEAMLDAESAEERAAAAAALIPLGRIERALPVLHQAIEETPQLVGHLAGVLLFLPWEQRLEEFQWCRRHCGEAELPMLAASLTIAPDERATEVLWQWLARPDTPADLRQHLLGAIAKMASGVELWNLDDRPSARKALREEAAARLDDGSAVVRMAALLMIAAADPAEVAEPARRFLADERLTDEQRRTAYALLLNSLPRQKANAEALEALQQADPLRRRMALRFLAAPHSITSKIPNARLLDYVGRTTSGESRGVPKPPSGLKAEDVRPLLSDEDASIRAMAGYLLALFEQKEGLKPLLTHYRSQLADDQAEVDDELTWMVVRAIAATNASEHIDVLRPIYNRLHEFRYGEFYWTIRIMSGREALLLRKQIRDEVGMENLH